MEEQSAQLPGQVVGRARQVLRHLLGASSHLDDLTDPAEYMEEYGQEGPTLLLHILSYPIINPSPQPIHPPSTYPPHYLGQSSEPGVGERDHVHPSLPRHLLQAR